MVPQVQDIGNSRPLGVVCCHASSACSGEELIMHVYINPDAAFLFSLLCPSSLSMAMVPKSIHVSWMGCNDEGNRRIRGGRDGSLHNHLCDAWVLGRVQCPHFGFKVSH